MKATQRHSVCVIGTGYVGLVTGACLAELGHRVVCVDSDRAKIRMLKGRRIPIYEPGLKPLVLRNMKAGRLFFTDSIRKAMTALGSQPDILFIAVGTPPRPDGSADLSYVEKATEEVARNLKGYAVVVDKSTVPVETGEWVARTMESFARREVPFDVASNPEFLQEGTAVQNFLHPDRIVLGVSSKRAERSLRELYAPLNRPILVTDLKSAELIKHASNSFLAAKISFINAVAGLCEKVGADVTHVAQGMGLDPRIGPQFLKPGVGFGGTCLPKDLEAFYWISRKKGCDFKLLKEVLEINEHQKGWPLRHLESELWNLEGKRVGVLGLSFKPNTDDLRRAPSLDIIHQLRERGVHVRVYDPVAMPKARRLLRGVSFCRDPYACARGSDALVLVTEWEEFAKLEWARVRKGMRHPVLLDGRNLLDPQKMRSLGFTYRSVGRP